MSLKETYEEWKGMSDLKFGLSTFVSFCAPHSVLAGGSSTHTVCVPMSHQNFKLMLHSSGLKETTEELFSTTVCQLDKNTAFSTNILRAQVRLMQIDYSSEVLRSSSRARTTYMPSNGSVEYAVDLRLWV
ncbi:hypothetical protein HPB48_009299 [Haemaphysalis longicornis]|uniref:Uncharacterized protein n=1 Tax=Haemaphysalis longicornis TaxID=44386 RepID=A0A9J6FF77_HAELO|nr:hypothetical protein HPB48_009299 [Haemaphysalis longicornis]